MKLQLLYSLTIFLLAFVACVCVCYAAISPEVYWKVKLPNTPIPKVIKDLLPQAENEVHTKEKVYYGLHQHGAWIFHDATEDEIREIKKQSPNRDELQHVNEGSNNAKSHFQDNLLYKPYFLEKDLEKGRVINFPSLKNKNEAPFLPRQFVESIPFSSKKLPEILNHFSIDSSSKDAKTIEETVKVCEEPAMKGERRKCATSLESMVDFSLSMLGTNNIHVFTTEVQGENQMLQKYTIEEVQQLADGVNMICHKLNYAYAVHFCHGGGITKTFMVSMIGADGAKVKAVSICHKDTSLWNPKGLPFVVLKAKPGTTGICHFLQDDQIVFSPF
ncbi:BURP domain-containing protein 6-like [Nicotiana tabacum]|uniref:BURP domain-containing protein 6-like n=1 Tax=Nicotiana tabacum TaxID=4097 RepID=UPI003F4E9C63